MFARAVLCFWAISDSERVSVKWLVGTGSKFWFRNTCGKVKSTSTTDFSYKTLCIVFFGAPCICVFVFLYLYLSTSFFRILKHPLLYESMQVHWLSEDLSQVWRDTGWYWVGVVTDPLKELFISSVPRYWVRADVNKLGVCTKCKISSQLTRAQSPPLSLYIWWSCSGLFTHLLYYLQAKNKK